MSFENKLAIVTGSYQGLGKGIAKEFAKNGSNLILVDIDEKLKITQEELKEYGNTVEIIIGDVSQESTAKSVMNIVETKFTGLDILVNNAGIGGINKTLWELPSEEFDRVYSINLKSGFETRSNNKFVLWFEGLILVYEEEDYSIVHEIREIYEKSEEKKLERNSGLFPNVLQKLGLVDIFHFF